ncbi:MAG: VWA domain-containing protein [Planctomycetota bacterium]|nr:VWA domain-containing protein [Planctomycetota bacterium]
MVLKHKALVPIMALVACSQPAPNPRTGTADDKIYVSVSKEDIRSRAALMKVLEKLAEAETPRESPEVSWITRYKEILKTRDVTCNFGGETLKDVFSFLSDVSGLNFVIHQEIDVEKLTVRYKADKVKLGPALKTILDQCQLTRRYHNEAIHIVPVNDKSILEFYDVSDIIKEVPDYPAPELALSNPNIIGIGRGASASAPRRKDMVFDIYDVSDIVSRIPDFPGPRIEIGEIENPKNKKKNELKTWKPSTLSPHTLRLKVGEKEELPLESLDVTVQIDAFQARVLIDASFFNPHGKQLDGQFQLRLPSGASPYYLAFGENKVHLNKPKRAQLPVAANVANTLSVRSKEWTAVKEARMVPRNEASRAYKSEVNKAVDPALLEWAGADIFRCQVYPLAPKKSHRIVLAYDLPLIRKDKSWLYKLELPKAQIKPSVHIFIRSTIQPLLSPRGQFKSFNESWRFDSSKLQSHRLEVTLPDSGPTLLADKDPVLGEHFAMRVQPQVPEMTDSKQYSRAVFLLDTSSSAKTGFAQRVQLLEAILTKNRNTIKEFAVLFFNIEQYWFHEGFQTNNSSNVDKLIRVVNKTLLEGSTDLCTALELAHSASWLHSENQDHCYFLLSDGATSWGRQAKADILSRIKVQPVYCYSFGFSGTNQDLLGAIARKSGGALTTAYNNSELNKAAQAHTKTPWTIERITAPGSCDLIIGGRAKTLYPGQNIILSGRGTITGPLSIELSSGGQTKRLQIAPRVLQSPMATRIYGQCASRQIGDLPSHSGSAMSFDLHYKIPGRRCSLLMLETEADYKAHFSFSLKKHLKIVKETKVQSLLEEAKTVQTKEASPRSQFQSLAQSLKKHPQITIRFSKSAEAILAQFSDADFELKVRPFQCVFRQKKSIEIDPMTIDWNAKALQLHKQGFKGDALRALSASLELEQGDPNRLRDVAYTALSWQYDREAVSLLREIIDKRPTEFLSYLTMARSLANLKLLKQSLAWFELTLSIQECSQDLRIVTSNQYLKLLTTILASNAHRDLHPFARQRSKGIAPSCSKIKTGSLVILSTWNTDTTDVDLHVTEIGGGHCSYNRRRLKSGAWLLGDVTRGYGPEQFVHPEPGRYPLKVEVSYFSSNQNRMSTTTRAYLTIFNDWNGEKESVKNYAVTLKKSKDKQLVTTLTEP